MIDKVKLPDLLSEIVLAKSETTETIVLTAAKLSAYTVAAKALSAAEAIFGKEGCYSIEPGFKGGSARVNAPRMGRTISGKVLLVSRAGQVASPKITSFAAGGKEGAITVDDKGMKITVYLDKVQSATLEDIEDAASVQATLGLVGASVTAETTGTIQDLAVVTIAEKDGTVKYRVFVETADGQYSFNSSTDLTPDKPKFIGQPIAKGFVGPICVLSATHVDSIDVTSDDFVAQVLRVDITKGRNKSTGESFDMYKLVTDKGVFMPNSEIRKTLKAIRPDIPMQLYKPKGGQIAFIRCEELTNKFLDLI